MPQKDTVTELDVKEPSLLVRVIRRLQDGVGTSLGRLDRLEAAPKPLKLPDIKSGLEARGSNPLNVTNLLGVLSQPQLAGAPRYSTTPTDQVLQQLRDTQLLLVGTTSTGYALNAAVGGNPTTLYQLLSGLTTASVTSTSTNLMTLDTAQTVLTGAIKTFQDQIRFDTNATFTIGAYAAIMKQVSRGLLLKVTPGAVTDFSLVDVTGNPLLTVPTGASDIKIDTGNLLFGKQTLGAAGTVGAPVYAFSTSTNSGLYSTSTGTVALATNGSQAVLLSTSGLAAGGTPRYKLDAYGTGDQIHASPTDVDSGLYVGGSGTAGGAISGGGRYDGTNWVAKDATAASVRVLSAAVEGYTNTGLVAGNTYTPTRRFRADAGGFIIDQTIYNYNGIATQGQGVPFIPTSVVLTGQSTSIGATNLYTAAPAGLYRASVYLDTSVAGAAGTVTATIGWNDGDSAENVTSGSASLSVVVGSFATLNQVLRSGAAQNITYSTTVTGAVGNPTYALSIVLERLA